MECLIPNTTLGNAFVFFSSVCLFLVVLFSGLFLWMHITEAAAYRAGKVAGRREERRRRLENDDG